MMGQDYARYLWTHYVYVYSGMCGGSMLRCIS